jgi:hypothetical protein
MVSGCRSSGQKAPDSTEQTRYRRILVVPFQDIAAVHGSDRAVQGPLSGQVFITSSVVPKAPQFLTAEVTRLLSRKIDMDSVIASRNDQIAISTNIHEQQRQHRIRAMSKAGLKVGADAVLAGYVYGFEERVGSNYGVDIPARVSIELNLISVAGHRLVWQDRFTETQKALNEDLLQLGKFLKRKGRWITAREMATNALRDMIDGSQVF